MKRSYNLLTKPHPTFQKSLIFLPKVTNPFPNLSENWFYYYYRLKVYIFPKFMDCNTNAQCDGVWSWALGGDYVVQAGPP